MTQLNDSVVHLSTNGGFQAVALIFDEFGFPDSYPKPELDLRRFHKQFRQIMTQSLAFYLVPTLNHPNITFLFFAEQRGTGFYCRMEYENSEVS